MLDADIQGELRLLAGIRHVDVQLLVDGPPAGCRGHQEPLARVITSAYSAGGWKQ